MKYVDIKLYNEISQSKRPTEIFIDYIQKGWEYSLVDYTADCIESIPFSIFDKVISGLLNIDGQLSYMQLGQILGLNIIDDPINGYYCDHAEEELLHNALNEMIDFGMVARSKFDASYYRLTDIGRLFFENQKKLRTRYNVNFRLFFDWTSGDHSEAKNVFSKVDFGKVLNDSVYPEMRNEELLKSFMYVQQPDIYNEEGNSFSNLKVNKAKNVSYPIFVGLLYDFSDESYRIVAIDSSYETNKYFNNILATKEKIHETCFKELLVKSPRVIKDKSSEQKEFEEETVLFAENLEGKSSKEKDNIVKDYESNNCLFEIEYFWQHLEDLINTNNTKKIYFFVEYLSNDIAKILSDFTYNHNNIYFYISYSKADYQIDGFQSNLFFNKIDNSNNKLACYCNENCVFEYQDFIHKFGNSTYSAKVIVKKENTDLDISKIEEDFAKTLIPSIIKYVDSKLKPKDFEPTNDSVEELKWYIDIIDQFGYWTDKLGYTTKVALLKVKQNKILKKVKMLHEEALYEELQRILLTNDISQIRKLEKILSLKKNLLDIWNESQDDYDKVRNVLSDLNEAIETRERFIKDTLIAKYFIFDTNVFLDDPHVLSKVKYQDYVILAARVTEELNKHKTNKNPEVSKNAQLAIKLIGNERRKENGHLIFERAKFDLLPSEFSRRDADNMILAVALNHKNENVCLVSSDEGLLQKTVISQIPGLTLQEFYQFIDKREADRKADIEETKKQQFLNSKSSKRNRK